MPDLIEVVVDATADSVLMQVGEEILKFARRVETGELRDPGTVEALRLAAKAIINVTDRMERSNATAN